MIAGIKDWLNKFVFDLVDANRRDGCLLKCLFNGVMLKFIILKRRLLNSYSKPNDIERDPVVETV